MSGCQLWNHVEHPSKEATLCSLWPPSQYSTEKQLVLKGKERLGVPEMDLKLGCREEPRTDKFGLDIKSDLLVMALLL